MKKFGFLLVALVLLSGRSGRSKQASNDEVLNSNVPTFCSDAGKSQFAGEQDGYIYELWNQNGTGTACMTIDSGAFLAASGKTLTTIWRAGVWVTIKRLNIRK
jgi:hypothetical protein